MEDGEDRGGGGEGEEEEDEEEEADRDIDGHEDKAMTPTMIPVMPRRRGREKAKREGERGRGGRRGRGG